MKLLTLLALLVLFSSLHAEDYVLSDIPETEFKAVCDAKVKEIQEHFKGKEADPTHLTYMEKLACKHAMSYILPKTLTFYGIVAPEGYTLVPDSIRPLVSNVTIAPASFDLRRIIWNKDGKNIETNLAAFLVHVKYQTRFSYRIQKDKAEETRETPKTRDMESHHYIFPEEALKTLFERLKIGKGEPALINGDLYMNPNPPEPKPEPESTPEAESKLNPKPPVRPRP